MTTWLLRLLPGWGWWLMAGALAGAMGWAYLQAVTAERDAALAQLTTLQGRVELLEGTLAWRRAETARLADTLDDREQVMADTRAAVQAARDDLAALERTDAPTRDWSADPVPDAIASWVRGLADAGSVDHPRSDNAQPTGLPAGATTGP